MWWMTGTPRSGWVSTCTDPPPPPPPTPSILLNTTRQLVPFGSKPTAPQPSERHGYPLIDASFGNLDRGTCNNDKRRSSWSGGLTSAGTVHTSGFTAWMYGGPKQPASRHGCARIIWVWFGQPLSRKWKHRSSLCRYLKSSAWFHLSRLRNCLRTPVTRQTLSIARLYRGRGFDSSASLLRRNIPVLAWMLWNRLVPAILFAGAQVYPSLYMARAPSVHHSFSASVSLHSTGTQNVVSLVIPIPLHRTDAFDSRTWPTTLDHRRASLFAEHAFNHCPLSAWLSMTTPTLGQIGSDPKRPNSYTHPDC